MFVHTYIEAQPAFIVFLFNSVSLESYFPHKYVWIWSFISITHVFYWDLNVIRFINSYCIFKYATQNLNIAISTNYVWIHQRCSYLFFDIYLQVPFKLSKMIFCFEADIGGLLRAANSRKWIRNGRYKWSAIIEASGGTVTRGANLISELEPSWCWSSGELLKKARWGGSVISPLTGSGCSSLSPPLSVSVIGHRALSDSFISLTNEIVQASCPPAGRESALLFLHFDC